MRVNDSEMSIYRPLQMKPQTRKPGLASLFLVPILYFLVVSKIIKYFKVKQFITVIASCLLTINNDVHNDANTHTHIAYVRTLKFGTRRYGDAGDTDLIVQPRLMVLQRRQL